MRTKPDIIKTQFYKRNYIHSHIYYKRNTAITCGWWLLFFLSHAEINSYHPLPILYFFPIVADLYCLMGLMDSLASLLGLPCS